MWPNNFDVEIPFHAVLKCFALMRHERTPAHLLKPANRLFLRKFDDEGPIRVIGFGLRGPKRESVIRYRFDLFVLGVKVSLLIERIQKQRALIGSPEFTVSDEGLRLRGSGLGKQADRSTKPDALAVVFGGKDARVRLAVRRKLERLPAVSVEAVYPGIVKLSAEPLAN